MQTSLRSSYQYYDYATLDCTTRHDQHPPDQDSSNQIHLPVQQLHHHQQQQHELIHHQALIGDTSFNQQETPTVQTSNCFDVVETQNNESSQQHQSGPTGEQLILYNQQHRYQLLDTSNHQHISHLETNSGQNQEVESIYSQRLDQLVQHHPEQTLLAGNGTSQQQHDSQTTTSYPTIYYDQINFTENCAVDQQQTIIEPGQAYASHLIDVSQFVGTQQPVGSIPDNCPYFQYHQAVVDEQDADRQGKDALLLDNQENQNYNDHQIALHSEQQNHIYQTLEVAGNQSNFETNQHNQLLDHNQPHHHPLGGVELGNEQHSQLEYQQLESNRANSYHINTCYIKSESTNASIARSQDSSACSTSSSEESSNSTLTRDEKRAREANIPLTYHQIVNLSIDHFNEQLTKHNLTESQLTLIKDIRRRGKNKVAAQSCRKRKMEQIYDLQHEVDHLASKKRALSLECNQLMKEHGLLVQRYNKIYPIIHCFNKDTWNS